MIEVRIVDPLDDLLHKIRLNFYFHLWIPYSATLRIDLHRNVYKRMDVMYDAIHFSVGTILRYYLQWRRMTSVFVCYSTYRP